MNRLNAVISALLLINGVFGIDFEIEYTPDSLTSNGWVNEGTLTGKDLNGLKGTVMPDVDGVNALCYDETKDIQSYIDYIAYNTHKSVNPELTMIIWIRPQPGYTPKNNDWLLGHDNGGYDRSIIVYDGRYKGIAMGVGRSYISTVSYPPAGKWTSITATFSENDKKATVYKNGGNDGKQQVGLSSDASGQSDIGLNGLRNAGNHNFVGCIGRVQIVNRVLSAQEVADEYAKGIEADPCGGACDKGEICVDGNCEQNCGIFDIDAFLGDCSDAFTLQNGEIDGIKQTQSQLRSDVDGNDGDISKLQTDLADLNTALQNQIDQLNDIICKGRKSKKKFCRTKRSAAMHGMDDWDGLDAIDDDEWDDNDNMNKPYPATPSIWDTWSWQYIVIVIFSILLMVNLIVMTYNNCCRGSNQQKKRRYGRVQYMDSEDVDSEANLK